MRNTPIRILFIEDSRADYLLIKRCLNGMRAQFELDWAVNLGEGLTKLMANAFDVVLCDLSLPDSRGVDTVRAVRDRNACIPVLVLTTASCSQLEVDALEAGAQEYVNKADATSATLERALRHSIQRQQHVVEMKCMLAELKSSRAMLAEQKRLLESKNRRLRKLFKTAQRFVDNVSHEFRTPLTVIKDYVTLVREGIVGPISTEQARMLDVAAVRTDDLNNMVDDLLDVSKLESGLLGLWRKKCQISSIVQATIPSFEKKAQVKNISFTWEVDENLPDVYCDGDKVGRVIINLVTNAMKFCGEPGVVHLWARECDDRDEVVVGVTDNGPGIDEQGLAELFQRFKQLNNSVKGSTKGFGLGLNIAKELVDLNFGEMHVDSQPGAGSTFSFSVPIAQPCNILRRYLLCAPRLGNAQGRLSLVLAAAPDFEARGDLDDLDAFFNYLLRRNDLLFRCGDDRWLFVLAASHTEVAEFLDRVASELEKANRNRPWGPLTPYELSVVGTWQLPDHLETLMNAFTTICTSEEAQAHAEQVVCQN